MKRLLTVALLLCATAAYAAPDMDKYNKSCAICHASGAANAPKTGDVEAWKPRLAKGADAMVASVNKGLNAMPPKGMCFDCSDADYKALIDFMSTAAK